FSGKSGPRCLCSLSMERKLLLQFGGNALYRPKFRIRRVLHIDFSFGDFARILCPQCREPDILFSAGLQQSLDRKIISGIPGGRVSERTLFLAFVTLALLDERQFLGLGSYQLLSLRKRSIPGVRCFNLCDGKLMLLLQLKEGKLDGIFSSLRPCIGCFLARHQEAHIHSGRAKVSRYQVAKYSLESNFVP